MNITIHKSPILLAFKIIVLELLIEAVYLVAGTLGSLVAQQFGYEVRLISPFTQLLLLPIQIGVLVWMLIRWSTETYEIQEEELIIKYGIIGRVEKAYPYRNMQSVVVKQSLLGRIVGAGTVSVFIPTLGRELVFIEVPNPLQFAESIKKFIPDAGNSQFILKK